ncbi:MAG: ATP-binding protein [Clostridiales bacterium]|nr:ATP-binding protein [Clostridiales bacterium]
MGQLRGSLRKTPQKEKCVLRFCAKPVVKEYDEKPSDGAAFLDWYTSCLVDSANRRKNITPNVGKTTTAEQIAASVLYMDDPEKKEQNITMSEISPKRLLIGAVPRLIDEWQLAPKLWDIIRFEVDYRDGLGLIILTGSAVPADTKEITHSGLGIGPNDLLNDLKTFGFLFETLCIRDLRVFADALNGEVYHYRDKEGQECDAVVHLRNGRYGLIEIKLGGDKLIEEGARSLKSMEAKLDTDRMRVPSFLMVLTGTGDYAYRRPDGVCVVPIGSLKN